MSEISFGCDIWIKLLDYDINLISSFSEKHREEACARIIKKYMVNDPIVKIQTICKYGFECMSLENDKFICNYHHSVNNTIETFIKNDNITNGCYKYGFIYLCTEDQYKYLLRYRIGGSIGTICYYRVGTGEMYDIKYNYNLNLRSLYNPRPYDYEKESNLDGADLGNKIHCKKFFEQYVMIDSKLELFYIIKINSPLTYQTKRLVSCRNGK